METNTEKISIKKRLEREKKLERVSLYFIWLDRSQEELYITWEQWLKLRQLRKSKEKLQVLKHKQLENNYVLYKTSFGMTIKRNKHDDVKKIDSYLNQLEIENYELQKFDTTSLFYTYINRNRHHRDQIWLDGKYYQCESIKFVLDTREHIPRSKDKKILNGKKDKKNGRKNPRS